MGQAISLPFELFNWTHTFYSGFFYYLNGKGRKSSYELDGSGDGGLPSKLRPDKGDSQEISLFKQHARIHLFSLASNFYLYHKPHYRKGTYREDLVDNLCNVAIPGTGIPLSIVARSRLVSLVFLVTAYPAVSFMAALHKWFMTRGKANISEEYATRLLAPDDWFNYWRLNCNIVGLHALLNDMPADYEMENKWTFLETGEAKGVPVSPFLKTGGLVVKNRNEEGGLGIYFYKNAVVGGDWIIQERIENSAWVSTLLPPKAPLSTFRVMTCSQAWDLSKQPQRSDVTALSVRTQARTHTFSRSRFCRSVLIITPSILFVSQCVFRAGRAGASTDHDSILFDVDVKSGLIKGGTTNAHWYHVGLQNALPGQCPWRSSHSYKSHPDGDIPVSGNRVPDIMNLLSIAEQSHLDLCPRVPLAGWDVVLSADPKLPVCLLEVNLSCNFFRGSFDKKVSHDAHILTANSITRVEINRPSLPGLFCDAAPRASGIMKWNQTITDKMVNCALVYGVLYRYIATLLTGRCRSFKNNA